jgi:hypothetical protein
VRVWHFGLHTDKTSQVLSRQRRRLIAAGIVTGIGLLLAGAVLDGFHASDMRSLGAVTVILGMVYLLPHRLASRTKYEAGYRNGWQDGQTHGYRHGRSHALQLVRQGESAPPVARSPFSRWIRRIVDGVEDELPDLFAARAAERETGERCGVTGIEQAQRFDRQVQHPG